MSSSFRKLTTFISLALLLAPTSVLSNVFGSETDPTNVIGAAESAADAGVGFSAGQAFIAPIPRATPTLGNSIYLIGGYVFQADAGSRTSFLGAGTMFNENGSDLNAIGGRLSLLSRKLQLRFGLAEGTLFYDAFANGIAVPVQQDATGAFLSVGYGVTDELTVGVISNYSDSVIKPDRSVFPIGFPVQDIDLETLRGGLFFEYETTDNDVFPRDGWRVNVRADKGWFQNNSSRSDFWVSTALIDRFIPVGERDAVALRGTLCASDDDAPYFIECSLGRTDKFRGFEFFRFGGSALASFQAEYRGRLPNRFGYSVYGGIGAAGDGFGGLNDAGWQGAVGAGLRYQLTKRFPLDLTLDVTLNSQNEYNAYVFIGQGF